MIDDLNGDVEGYPGYSVQVKHATEHRVGVRIRGPNLTNDIDGTDPLKDNRKLCIAKPLDDQD